MRSSFPRHFEIAESLLDMAEPALLRLAQVHRPSDLRPYHFALTLLYQKGLKSFWSVIRLCEARLADDAGILVRSLLNLLIVARWIRLGTDSDRRARWYLEWFWIAAKPYVARRAGEFRVLGAN
jgi:hypothetical protein